MKKIFWNISLVLLILISGLFFIKGYTNTRTIDKNKSRDELLFKAQNKVRYLESYVYFYNYGIYNYQKEKYDLAINQFKQARNGVIKSRKCDVEINLGYSIIEKLLKEKDSLSKSKIESLLNEALKAFNKCLKVEPKNASAKEGKEIVKKARKKQKGDGKSDKKTDKKDESDRKKSQESDKKNGESSKDSKRRQENQSSEDTPII